MGRCAGIERNVNVIRMYTNIIHNGVNMCRITLDLHDITFLPCLEYYSTAGGGYFCTYTSRYFLTISCPSISISSRLGQSRCAPTLGTPAAHHQRIQRILPLDSPSRITNTKQLQGPGMRAPTLGSKSESESAAK